MPSTRRHIPIIDEHVETIAKYFHHTKEDKKNPLYFGLELEVERFNNDTDYSIIEKENTQIAKKLKKINKFIHIKKDGSILNGFEIADQPQTLNYFYNNIYNWQLIFDILCENEFYEDNNAGFHIHVNSNYFSDNEIMKLRYFVNTHKQLFIKIGRRSDGYHYTYTRLLKNNFTEELINDEIACRNECLNITNRNKRGTLEFRLFRSTIDIQLFIATIEFVDCLIKYIKQISNNTIINKLDAKLAFSGFYFKSLKNYNCLDYFKKDILQC